MRRTGESKKPAGGDGKCQCADAAPDSEFLIPDTNSAALAALCNSGTGVGLLMKLLLGICKCVNFICNISTRSDISTTLVAIMKLDAYFSSFAAARSATVAQLLAENSSIL